jgi:hypothetical protein
MDDKNRRSSKPPLAECQKQYKQAIAALRALVVELDKLEEAARLLQKASPLGQLRIAARRLSRQAMSANWQMGVEAEALEPKHPPLKPEPKPVPRRQVN